jgi:hypothetical protein
MAEWLSVRQNFSMPWVNRATFDRAGNPSLTTTSTSMCMCYPNFPLDRRGVVRVDLDSKK